ncbi:glycosyltransferase [uncultured Fusobacterium sp.]|uniref:glycosyltransferase n=1 Tax=uncultured Fusobacterium sp. TaxID=159267 RepID=UPI002592A4FB|nr:glycosyltransferase [uncultured Fusobacterium sp.]
MRKIKLLFYNGSLRMGGIERVMIDVLESLDKKKFDITLVIEDDAGELNIFAKSIPNEINLIYLKSKELIKKTEFYKYNRRKNILAKVMYGIMMKYEGVVKRKNLKKISENRYDVIVDFDMGLSKYISYFNCNKKIVWIHASITNWYNRKDKIYRLGKRLEKYNKIVTICDEMKNETINLYPFLERKILRIYNPVSFIRIRNLAEANTKKYMPLIEEKYIVAVMRLTEKQKDFDTLINAWLELKNKKIYIKLLLLGDGPDREKIKDKIRVAGLEDTILLLGNVENPYVLIKHAELLVHSSKYEGLPTILIEALVLKKYIISSECSTGPKEILRNGQLGKLYKVGDYKTLAELIQNKIIHDESIDEKIIENNIKEYNKELVIEKYEALFEEK